MQFISENKKIALLLVLFGSVMLGNLGGWDLKGADEPRYAQVAREMLESGQYIVPHVNSEIYSDKPPLFFWLISLAALPQGDVSAFAARLPSALAGLGLIFLTYLFAARLFDRAAGLLAAGVLFCCEQFFCIAVSAHFDVILAFWTTLALLLFQTGFSSHRKKFILWAYAAIGAAILTKGPVGLVIPLATMLLYCAARKEYGKIKELQIGTGLVIALGIAACWLAPACIMGGKAYTQDLLFTQTFGRTIQSFAHQEPIYYYLLNFPVDFLPWTIFLPAAAVHFWQNRDARKAMLLPLIWFAFTFIMFSLVSGKRSLYLLPLFPAAAMLMGKFFADCIRAGVSQGAAFTWSCHVLAVALPACGITALYLLIGTTSPVNAVPAAGRLVLAAAALASIAASIFWFYKRQQYQLVRRAPYLIIACVTVVYGLWTACIFPALINARPERDFCETVVKTVRPGDKLYATFSPEFFNYFLHRSEIRVIKEPLHFKELMGSPETTYCLMRDKEYKKLPDTLKKMTMVLHKDTVGHKTMYLIQNKSN